MTPLRDRRPVILRRAPKLELVRALDWTERTAYKKSLAELARMNLIEGERERQLIREAEREAELRFLRAKQELVK